MKNKIEIEYMTKIEKEFLSEEEIEQLTIIRTYKLNDANGEMLID